MVYCTAFTFICSAVHYVCVVMCMFIIYNTFEYIDLVGLECIILPINCKDIGEYFMDFNILHNCFLILEGLISFFFCMNARCAVYLLGSRETLSGDTYDEQWLSLWVLIIIWQLPLFSSVYRFCSHTFLQFT